MSDSPDDNLEVELLRPSIVTILKNADRTSITAKGVRKQLQEMYPGMDIKAHKTSIDEVTYAVFNQDGSDGDDDDDDEVEVPIAQVASIKPEPSTNGHLNGRVATTTTTTFPPQSSPAHPLKQKEKKPSTSSGKKALTDEQVAQRLQAELNARPSRGSASSTTTTTTKTWNSSKVSTGGTKRSAKSKSAATVDSDDDGSLDPGAAPKKKKRKVSNTGFNKLHRLSSEMAGICGTDQLSRPGVTKALWVYIKANDLQVPTKKTDIRLDDKLKKIFPGSVVNSFTMAKYIGSHLYPLAPEDVVSKEEVKSDDEAAATAGP